MTVEELLNKGFYVDCYYMKVGEKLDIIDILKSFGLLDSSYSYDLRFITRIGNIHPRGNTSNMILLGNGLPTPEQSERQITYELLKAVDLDEKVELKDGDKVKLSGYSSICFVLDGRMYYKRSDSQFLPVIRISRYGKDLEYLGYPDSKFEIMEVQRDGKTIFKRDNTVEVSMKEIADWKGVDVKDIRIKD